MKNDTNKLATGERDSLPRFFFQAAIVTALVICGAVILGVMVKRFCNG